MLDIIWEFLYLKIFSVSMHLYNDIFFISYFVLFLLLFFYLLLFCLLLFYLLLFIYFVMFFIIFFYFIKEFIHYIYTQFVGWLNVFLELYSIINYIIIKCLFYIFIFFNFIT